MANTGREEQDRDWCGIWFAVIIMVVLTGFQYLQFY